MLRSLLMGFAIAFFFFQSSAAAQDGSEGGATRTPAGARNFLQTLAKERGLSIWMERPRSDPTHAVTYVNLGVQEVIAEGDCVTVFNGPAQFYPGEFYADLDFPFAVSSRPEDAQKIDKFVAVTGLPRPPFRIEWKTMSNLRIAGGGSDGGALYIENGNFKFLTSNDRATYDRLFFALKFLAERCSLPEVDGF